MAVNPWLVLKAGTWAYRKYKARKARKEDTMFFKGKLTYTALAAVVAPVMAQLLGVDVVQSEVVQVFQAVAALIGVYGRWRATK